MLDDLKYVYLHDKTLPDCERQFRPDFAVDMGSYMLFIEIDEWGHCEYLCPVICGCQPGQRHRDCQQLRMQLVSESAGKTCMWLRVNPDGVPGIIALSAPWTAAIKDRIERAVTDAQQTPPTKHSVQYLYYDGQSDDVRALM